MKENLTWINERKTDIDNYCYFIYNKKEKRLENVETVHSWITVGITLYY